MIKRIERGVENFLFLSRWLLAPFYLGLVGGIVLMLIVFFRELAHVAVTIVGMPVEGAILGMLSLIDLALAANLVLIVILAGYENFVSRIEHADPGDRPEWMGKVGFAGLKLKLYGSIVAISGIELLKAFMGIGRKPLDSFELTWLTVIHLTFVMTTVLSALTDWLSARSKGSSA